MTAGKRSVFEAAFEARAALAAAKGDRTTAQPTSPFGVLTSQVTAWKKLLTAQATELFADGRQRRPDQTTDEQELYEHIDRRLSHLGGREVEAAEFLNHGRLLPGADALDVHLGDGEGHRPLAAEASFERSVLERPPVLVKKAKGLRDAEGDLADAGLEGLRLESVGLALTGPSSLMRLGCEHLLSLDEQGREAFDRRTFILAGHRRSLLGGVKHFQENVDGPPLQLGPPVCA